MVESLCSVWNVQSFIIGAVLACQVAVRSSDGGWLWLDCNKGKREWGNSKEEACQITQRVETQLTEKKIKIDTVITLYIKPTRVLNLKLSLCYKESHIRGFWSLKLNEFKHQTTYPPTTSSSHWSFTNSSSANRNDHPPSHVLMK